MNPEELGHLADEVRKKLRFKEVCTTIADTHGLHAKDVLVSAFQPSSYFVRFRVNIGPESVELGVDLIEENLLTPNIVASRLLRRLEAIAPTDPTLEPL